ncbi:MAG: ComEC/Rec2 family competence protein, partial [Sphingomicrobium sp.]
STALSSSYYAAMQWMSAPNIAGAPLPQRARGYWKARIGAARDGLEAFLERERGQLPPWVAVGFGGGIAAWFALDQCHWAAFICFAAGLGLAGFVARGGRAERALGWLGLALALGCTLIWVRSIEVASPRLGWPRIAEFRATVERVETLAAKGDIRLTLAPAGGFLPPRVRVSLDADGAPTGLAAGAIVQLRARIAPPPPMALPGSYDFARDAWFRKIGGVGRTLGPVTVLRPAEPTGLDRVRDRLGRHIRDRLPGPSGAIALALATGDQNAVDEADADAMRRSGLTHLLSVSGLHIAAAVGAAMLLTLKLLALSERLALRFNLVLVAAGAGALAGIGYTLLTGAQVPTVRSCIAALLVLAGIALGRDALSMRLLAVGALVVLLFRPEALAGASFQLSFAAVASIIALHSSAWGRRLFERRDEGPVARLARALLGLTATGLAVELTLIPFALYHFHRAGLYGVGANLIAIPLTTFVIMPLEALSLLLDSVGLGRPLWWLTGLSIDALLALAHRVAGARGAVAMLATMPPWSFAMIVAGGLWLFLWTSRARLLGLVPAAIGAAGAALAPVPDLLITGDGRHLALVEHGVPLLLRERSGDYVRDLMAESAGFEADPQALEGRPFTTCSRDACAATVQRGGRNWRMVATRSAISIDWRVLTRACAAADIVVSDRWLPRDCTPKWLKLDRAALGRTGGLAIYLGETPRVTTVAERLGAHPWAIRPPALRSSPNPRRSATPRARFRRDR